MTGVSQAQIARQLGRHRATIGRELARNPDMFCGYHYLTAERLASTRRTQASQRYKLDDLALQSKVQCALIQRWSPQQIAGRLKRKHPNNPATHISHEAIYQWLYRQHQQGHDWYTCMRRPRVKRRSRCVGKRGETRGMLPGRVGIECRSPVVDRRDRFGDWEADTVEDAKGTGLLVTQVERKSLYVMLIKLDTKQAATLRRVSINLFASLPSCLRRTWEADFSRPALAPKLTSEPDDLWITNANGERVINYANGCIEDKLYLTAACRMSPPGPYWDHDEPLQCTPSWALTAHETFGDAATQNLTVNVLFEIDPQKLAQQDYDHCFSYVGPLTYPSRGDNRDAFLFPEKLMINGQSKYVCVHRPRDPWQYPGGKPDQSPAIYLAAAQTLEDLPSDQAFHIPLAQGLLPWEGNRVGGSFPPIRIADNQWLLPYHGKQNDEIGYTQSFMILEQDQDGWPRLKHRCPDRLLYATQNWQHSDRFTIPCIFTCGGVITNDQQLLMSYGAADEVIGTAKTDIHSLIQHIQRFDHNGQLINSCQILP